jgi:hypothetical protein
MSGVERDPNGAGAEMAMTFSFFERKLAQKLGIDHTRRKSDVREEQ